MTLNQLSLEAAGTELHIAVNGQHFELPLVGGVVQRRDVIDAAYDVRLTMQDLGNLYRAIEGLGVQLDGPAYVARF